MDRTDHSSADPNFRWRGQKTDGPKTPETAALARKNQFATIEEFAAWRRSKGMPDLVFTELAWAFARFKGESVSEQAIANPIVERRARG